MTANIGGAGKSSTAAETNTQLEEANATLNEILDEAIATDNGVAKLGIDNDNQIIPSLGTIASSSQDIAGYSASIAQSTDNIDANVQILHTDLGTVHTDSLAEQILLSAGNTNTAGIRTDLGVDGASPPSILGSGVRGWLRAIYDQITDYRPSSSTITIADSGSSSSVGQNNAPIITGTATVGSTYAVTILGESSVRVQISGTWVGTLVFEVSADSGVTWSSTALHVTGTTYIASSITGNGLFSGEVSGITNFRVRQTIRTSGTVTVRAVLSPATGTVKISNALRVVDNTTGGTLSVSTTGAASVSDRGTASTITPVSTSTTSATLIAANTSRKEVWIYNDSLVVLYLKFGATASSTSYTMQVPAGGTLVEDKYTGIIDATLASGTGTARVTEVI